MRVLCCAYRQWGKDITRDLAHKYDVELIGSREEYSVEYIKELDPDVILFLGWSWHIENEIIDNYLCLCLHPSPLPRYRGGSPIQHQILNGEDESAVSVFKMTKERDAGPLCIQESFPLEGSMREILERIYHVGVMELTRILDGYPDIEFWDQVGEPTLYIRRQPWDSEITADEIERSSARQLHDKIRALQSPYPNAFIECGDGSRLYITDSHLGG